MPRKKEPLSLFTLSERVVVDYLTEAWSLLIFSDDTSANMNSIISCIPVTYVDSVVSLILKKYVLSIKECDLYRVERRSSSDMCTSHFLLKAIVVPQLQCLDFSCLVNIGRTTDFDILKFQTTMLSLIPYLSRLVRLSFATHKNDNTLPMCNDNMLKKISFSCRNLKSLNVMCCNYVSDDGLKCLVPQLNGGSGCPFLEELFLFETDVSPSAVAIVLENLPRLRLVDYRELCAALTILQNKCLKDGSALLQKGLKLTHINNVGYNGKTMRFDKKAVNVVKLLCPHMRNLKVRVTDFDVTLFPRFPNLTCLELVYIVGRPSSPGLATENYLLQYGYQLTILTLKCNIFAVEMFTVIGENCINLKQLWIRCNEFLYFPEWEAPASKQLIYANLDSLYVRVGEMELSDCFVPDYILSYVLRNSCILTSLQLIFRSPSVTDSWFHSLLVSIPADSIERLLVAVPGNNKDIVAIGLTMVSVDTALALCPNLKYIGNLIVWNVTNSEVKELKQSVCRMNLDLNVVCRNMYIK